MRVAIVSPYALDRPGGVQSHARQLAAHLNRLGDQAWLVGPGRGPFGAGEWRLGRAVGIRANGSIAPISIDPLIGRKLEAALRGADVVHVHEPLVPLVGWAAQRVEVPLVLTFHADPSRVLRAAYRWLAPLLRRLVERAAAVTAVSHVAAGAIAPFAPQARLIPNAVDANPYAGAVDRDRHRVVFVGRDEPRKGLDVLLAAWPRVVAAVPTAALEVVSSRDAAERPGVRFHVGVDDETKLRMLAGAAIFCAPNLGGESFGITVAEGMAAGCAVVASDLPAFRDLLGSAGRLVTAGDPAALAAALVELLGDDARRRAAIVPGERVAAYTWETVAPAYRALFRSL